MFQIQIFFSFIFKCKLHYFIQLHKWQEMCRNNSIINFSLLSLNQKLYLHWKFSSTSSGIFCLFKLFYFFFLKKFSTFCWFLLKCEIPGFFTTSNIMHPGPFPFFSISLDISLYIIIHIISLCFHENKNEKKNFVE